ncbi:MAG TPA: hypothetical protein VGQ62_06120 [Chloroflexota bacterium]|jgi:hypothetical protein|nr:hypothetical protein [Chloroflexota bacterium]
MTVTTDDLATMSQADLDDLFRRSPRGDLPDGDAVGTVILGPGTPLEVPVMWFARWLAWQGKVVYRSRGYLVNKVGPLGLHLFKARVYVAPSWFDNQPAIILDYSKTSLLAHKVRDEIREVSPGTYLGIVFYGGQKTINFVLDFSAAAHQQA